MKLPKTIWPNHLNHLFYHQKKTKPTNKQNMIISKELVINEKKTDSQIYYLYETKHSFNLHYLILFASLVAVNTVQTWSKNCSFVFKST